MRNARYNRGVRAEPSIGCVVISVWLLFVIMYGINIYKLVQCDFASDYKCEILHGVGVVVAPASVVTAWVGTDESD